MADDDRARSTAAAFDRLEAALRHIGLFVDGAPQVHACDADHTCPGPLIVVVDCLVGDLAWSDRVQNPTQVDVDDEFAQIQASVEREEYEARRVELWRRFEAGESLFTDDGA